MSQSSRPPNRESEAYCGAPYNFVPLPGKARPAEDTIRDGSYYQSDKKSGYFDCSLVTRTPLYIRSTLTEEEYNRKLERESKSSSSQKIYSDDKANFFAPGNKVRLPGSSLRGMIRSLVEIMSESQFLRYSNRQLFYRAVGGRTAQSIVQQYRQRLQPSPNQMLVAAGYVRKEGSQYRIYPAKTIAGFSFFQIFTDTAAHATQIRKNEWERLKIWFKVPSSYAGKPLINEIKARTNNTPSNDVPAWEKGWLVISGGIPGKKRSWIIPEGNFNTKGITIPLEDVQAYRDSGGLTDAIKNVKTKNTSTQGFSVLPEKANEECPCFFIEWKDKKSENRVSFGHTAYFRLPYEHKPGDLLKEQLPDLKSGQLDMTEAIFGTAASRLTPEGAAGRVFFEDALPVGPVQYVSPGEELIPQILSTPKPTTFQHYLDQSEAESFGAVRERMQKLKFWDAPQAKVRGYKLYWHRPGATWQVSKTEAAKHASQYTQMSPLAANNTFSFRVRFENLTEVEVGVLAAALQLPAGYAHKLGMGKPLGLGSVQITARLVLIDRQARYRRLFAPGEKLQWETGQTGLAMELVYYQDKFASWVSESANTSLAELWEKPYSRWAELRAMLNFNYAPLPENTRYMRIETDGGAGTKENEYKERPILPKASQIWKPPVTGSSSMGPKTYDRVLLF